MIRKLFICILFLVIGTLAQANLNLSPTLAERGGKSAGESELEARLQALEAGVLALQAAQEVWPYMRIETGEINGLAGPHMIIGGVNVHIRHSLASSGQTYGTSSTGLGNLVIGWNEDSGGNINANDRLGSHNLIIGGDHKYTNSGCFLAGRHNTASGTASSVSGGGSAVPEEGNEASGDYASVSGGSDNTASGPRASVSGGWNNTASGWFSSVSGGRLNVAGLGIASSVSGGLSGTAPLNYNWTAGCTPCP